MTKKRIAVIGAGPAGATAAYQLSKHLKSGEIESLDLYEASNTAGGLARSIKLWDQTVDLGPHRFFSNDKRVNSLWLEVVGEDYEMVDRMTRIFYKGKFFHYPLKPFNALNNLGLVEAFNCGFSYMREKLSPTELDGTFETWVTNRFGKKLYEVFFKTYSEKLWGIKCTELDADFAAQRIKKLSLFEAIKNAVSTGKNNQHKTLVEQFAYPIGGTGMVYERMLDFIVGNNGKVHLEAPVEKVLVKNGIIQGLKLKSGEIRKYDEVISSMPISLLIKSLDDAPVAVKHAADSLKFRNTILVYLKVEDKDLFPDQWLYIHSSSLETGRITNFRNWVPHLYAQEGSTILCLEYWCNFEDEFWGRKDADLIQLASQEIEKAGLLGDAAISEGFVFKIPRCYPVYFTGYKDVMKPIEAYLGSIKGLQAIGRYGAYKYNNQDHSILMGLLAAENVLKNANNNLWEINTDYDAYQEETVITKTGLVEKTA